MIPRTALGSTDGIGLRLHGKDASVELREVQLTGMLDVRLIVGAASALQTREIAHGLKLPQTPNKLCGSGLQFVLSMGPGQWLVVTPTASLPGITDALTAGFTKHCASADFSIVDASDMWAIFELVGPHAPDVLRKGCAIDVHPRVFASDDCAWTVLARVRVGLHHTDDRPGYRLFVERSYADYLWNWLTDAMMEFDTE